MTAAVGCLLAVSSQAAKLDAEAVFEKAAPSVVQLKSVDSEGSGGLIHGGGWILTNLHVAASGTPMTVTFSDADGNVTRKIEGATVFRVHPTYDLAIPLAGMDWKTFVEPAKRTGNRERYQQAINLASRARMAGALSMFGNPSGGLPDHLAAAAYYSRLALTEFPADEEAFQSLIEVYSLASKQDICLELARGASRVTGAGVFLS